ncbi:hypothetical protein ACN24K_14075 [Streptomyces microflavus]|uniref:Uncharacterized protein n=1 Tax=Streptomyces microflavus TaxID=1919 RepID=A0A7J0CVS7_STRMI|nr:hypothetical protein Smic_51960 [Streptomyces microflavus]
MQGLLNRLEADINGLSGARLNLQGADVLSGQQFRLPSAIDGY